MASATVNLSGTVVSLPLKVSAGAEATEDEAANLQEIWVSNLIDRARTVLKSRPHITTAELQSETDYLISSYSLPPPRLESGDLVEAEAISIAREMLITQLAAEGLPPPKNIEDHIAALLQAAPRIREQASLRITAQLQARERILRGIGL